MKLIKYLPLLLTLLILLGAINLSAVETFSVDKEIIKKENIVEVQSQKKGFLKRVYRKISEKVRKARLTIVKKVKRIFSKRKARKNRTRGSLKNRNRNLYNVLVFSGLFLLVASLFSLLFIYSLISLKFLIILGIALIVATIVIGLIYFSRRFTVKPNFK